MKNGRIFATIVFAFGLSSAQLSYAVPACTDYNGTWAGSCTLATQFGSFTFPQTATLNFSADCSMATIRGFNILAPGVENMRVGAEMRTMQYTFNGFVQNQGTQGVSVHWNQTEGSVLVIAHNSLLGYMPSTGANSRSILRAPYRFTLKNGELESEEDTEISGWGNGGNEIKAFIKAKCKYER